MTRNAWNHPNLVCEWFVHQVLQFFWCPKLPSIFFKAKIWKEPLAGYIFFVEDDKNWNFFDALATFAAFLLFGSKWDFPTEFAQFSSAEQLEVVAISLFSMAGSLCSLDKHHLQLETKLCQGYHAASGSIWQWSGTQRCPLAWLVNRHWSVVLCCRRTNLWFLQIGVTRFLVTLSALPEKRSGFTVSLL